MSERLSFQSDAATRRLIAQYLTPEVAAARGAVLQALTLREGEAVADIGCGPGLLAHELAAAVGAEGRLCGLDLSEPMIASCRERCAAQPWAEFRVGNAVALPYADGAFDAAAITQVYEFVDDLDTALAELYRVLKPGGRAAILDTDWATLTWHARDPERNARMLAFWRGQFADARLPLTLAARLRAAGFHVAHREPVVHFTPELHANSYSGHLMGTIAANATAKGAVPEAECQAWLAELHELAAERTYFFALNRYLFVAGRPA